MLVLCHQITLNHWIMWLNNWKFDHFNIKYILNADIVRLWFQVPFKVICVDFLFQSLNQLECVTLSREYAWINIFATLFTYASFLISHFRFIFIFVFVLRRKNAFATYINSRFTSFAKFPSQLYSIWLFFFLISRTTQNRVNFIKYSIHFEQFLECLCELKT